MLEKEAKELLDSKVWNDPNKIRNTSLHTIRKRAWDTRVEDAREAVKTQMILDVRESGDDILARLLEMEGASWGGLKNIDKAIENLIET